jgi:hypothetical protein
MVYYKQRTYHLYYVRFEVFTAMTIKNAVFWDVTPCRSCMNRHLGETYRIHLQGIKIRERGAANKGKGKGKVVPVLN